MVRSVIAGVAAFAIALWSDSSAAQTEWTMVTEYPASSISGQGLATLSELVAAKSGGALTISVSFDAAGGVTSGQMIQAVEQGRLAVVCGSPIRRRAHISM